MLGDALGLGFFDVVDPLTIEYLYRMRQPTLPLIVLVLIWSFIFFACKKDQDQLPPLVQVVAPSGPNPSYDYEDLLYVQMIATDDHSIVSWSIRLSDESGRVRFNSGIIPLAITGTRIEESYSFVLDDIHWPSGDYVLGIFVQDEYGNEGAAFKEIRYNEAPLALEQIFLISATSTNTDLLTFDLSGETSVVGSLPQDFSVGFAGSWHSELVIGGNSSAIMSVLSDSEFETTGAFISTNPLSGNFIRAIHFDPEGAYYFVSFFDGFVRCFGASGSQHLVIDVGANFRPESLTTMEDHLFVEVRQTGTDNYFIRDYDKHSGTLLNSNVLPGDALHIASIQDNLYVFGNADTDPFLLLYDPIDLAYYEPGWLISDQIILDIEPIQNGFFAVAHGDGVYLHHFSQNIFMWGSNNGIVAKDIGFDPSLQRLFVLGNDAAIHQLSPSTGMIMNSWNVTPSSEAILLQMNK